jgi:hypothetical protein
MRCAYAVAGAYFSTVTDIILVGLEIFILRPMLTGNATGDTAGGRAMQQLDGCERRNLCLAD